MRAQLSHPYENLSTELTQLACLQCSFPGRFFFYPQFKAEGSEKVVSSPTSLLLRDMEWMVACFYLLQLVWRNLQQNMISLGTRGDTGSKLRLAQGVSVANKEGVQCGWSNITLRLGSAANFPGRGGIPVLSKRSLCFSIVEGDAIFVSSVRTASGVLHHHKVCTLCRATSTRLRTRTQLHFSSISPAVWELLPTASL